MTLGNDDGGAGRGPDETEAGQDALAFWREYPAEMFNHALKEQVHDCVRRMSSTMEDWRAASGGDVAAAIKVAVRMRMPEEVTAALDVTMTVLLAVAFEDADAAAVMAHLVNLAPIDPIDRTGLTTSWLLHKIWCESRIRNARRRRHLHGPEGS
jgi:hypothetical protein